MRVLICGDRHWTDSGVIDLLLVGLKFRYEGDLVLIEGCAPGADHAACEWGKRHLPQEQHQHYPADWGRFKRGAGPVRNQAMLDLGDPDVVFAYHNDLTRSSGTVDMIRRAREAGVRAYHNRIVGG